MVLRDRGQSQSDEDVETPMKDDKVQGEIDTAKREDTTLLATPRAVQLTFSDPSSSKTGENCRKPIQNLGDARQRSKKRSVSATGHLISRQVPKRKDLAPGDTVAGENGRSFSPWRYLVSNCMSKTRAELSPFTSPIRSTDAKMAPISNNLKLAPNSNILEVTPTNDYWLPAGARFSAVPVEKENDGGSEVVVASSKLEMAPKPTNTEVKPFFRPSRFSHVPPTIRFGSLGEKIEKPKRSVCKLLKWCNNSLVPKVVRKCLSASHFEIVDENAYWLGYWGRHLKTSQYRSILAYQKVNHFAGGFNMGRKDRLWAHLNRMGVRWGKPTFDLMPRTFVLPRDAKRLKMAFRNGKKDQQFILKPPASARGAGIRVIHRWKQVPKKTAVVVQDYVDKPFLINGNKFDLRLYVYVSSFQPLRIYLYENGLVRFASVKYSNAVSTLNNRFMHLTNYSINKLAPKELGSENVGDGVVKWTTRQLWRYLSDRGHDVSTLLEQIIDLILKAVISCESSVSSYVARHTPYAFVSHELFGFDILLDANLKPWLLEINISPSLHSGSELDVSVKSALARDVLNLAGLQVPDKQQVAAASPRLSPSMTEPTKSYSADFRLKPVDSLLTADETRKRMHHVVSALNSQGASEASILDDLTPGDVRLLVEMEDELDRRGHFTRIFPSPLSSAYLRFFDKPQYANLLLDQWTSRYYHSRHTGCELLESLCKEKRHLVHFGTNIA